MVEDIQRHLNHGVMGVGPLSFRPEFDDMIKFC